MTPQLPRPSCSAVFLCKETLTTSGDSAWRGKTNSWSLPPVPSKKKTTFQLGTSVTETCLPTTTEWEEIPQYSFQESRATQLLHRLSMTAAQRSQTRRMMSSLNRALACPLDRPPEIATSSELTKPLKLMRTLKTHSSLDNNNQFPLPQLFQLLALETLTWI